MHSHEPARLSRRRGVLAIPALLAGLGIFWGRGLLHAQGKDGWEQSPEAIRFREEMEARRAELVRLSGRGTYQKLTAELATMRKVDKVE